MRFAQFPIAKDQLVDGILENAHEESDQVFDEWVAILSDLIQSAASSL